MRRGGISRREVANSNGIRCALKCPRLVRKLSKYCWCDPPISTGAESLRIPREDIFCSSDLESTAENSAAPQVLPGAMNCSSPAPIPSMPWQCTWRAPEEQFLAAQSGAHIGAASNTNIVMSAKTTALAGRVRIGIIFRILSTLRYAARFEPSTFIPPSVLSSVSDCSNSSNTHARVTRGPLPLSQQTNGIQA